MTAGSIYEQLELSKDLGFAKVYLHNELPIILVRYAARRTIDLELAKSIVDAVYEHNKAGYFLGITDIRVDFHETTSEARAFLSDNKSLKLYKAHAVLVDNLAKRILVNIFIKLNKPIVPFRMFSEEKEALDWLLKFQS